MSDTINIASLIEEALERVSICRAVYVSSFKISEEYIRELDRLKSRFSWTKSVLLLDRMAMLSVQKRLPYIISTFDRVYVGNNHSKVILIEGDNVQISVITSQNMTRGNRCECTILTTDVEIFYTLLQSFEEQTQKSLLIDETDYRTITTGI